ncbi:hypothetical protein AKJ63_00330 [candidate division MSBL1 archaeon SCGC-AAA259D18]|uniref:Uncharacterized protein n=1 Tax=candidate division MSBL1 archaeon SCGC-AAA259D18 TaxID=1698262 RepID=A0A133UCQ6_9EURY|nr:hypothetical protein AKJ63_00330 [candidate division MSBL1 archaeon SCGC-AAA259D18]
MRVKELIFKTPRNAFTQRVMNSAFAEFIGRLLNKFRKSKKGSLSHASTFKDFATLFLDPHFPMLLFKGEAV